MSGHVVSAGARECLEAAKGLARASGGRVVDGGLRAISRAVGRSLPRVQPEVCELEAIGAVRRTGPRQVDALLVVRLRLRMPPAPAPLPPPPALDRVSHDPEWRSLRARAGGLERALREVQAQRDDARAQLAAILESRQATRAPSEVALRDDLTHAADCCDPSCARCEAILHRLDVGRPAYSTADELEQRLRAADWTQRAGAALVAALKAKDKELLHAGALALVRAQTGDVGGARGALRGR